MVLANEAVSKEFSDIPFLYRVHEQPTEEDTIKLKDTLAKFNIILDSKEVNASDISKILREIK